MINRVILIGNLTRDAETIPAKSAMTRMRLATNRAWRDDAGTLHEEPEYHTVISFGRLAEICAAYCVKGMRVYVDGRIRTREYIASDGTRKFVTEIVADTVRFLDRRDPKAEPDPDGRRETDGEPEEDAATMPALAAVS